MPLTVHARVVAPALDITLLLFGIPLVLGPIRRGIFIAVGLCVGLTVVFFSYFSVHMRWLMATS